MAYTSKEKVEKGMGEDFRRDGEGFGPSKHLAVALRNVIHSVISVFPWFLPRNDALVQSAVLQSHVVRLSVTLAISFVIT